MGVIACVGCGAPVNGDAARCPECGADPRTGAVDEKHVAPAPRPPLDPVIHARAASIAGLAFLEVALPMTEAETLALGGEPAGEDALAVAAARSEKLASIEAEGWTLVGGSYALRDQKFEQTPMFFDPWEHGRLEGGRLMGVYLFRAAAPPEPGDSRA
jgi:hypothetical protein